MRKQQAASSRRPKLPITKRLYLENECFFLRGISPSLITSLGLETTRAAQGLNRLADDPHKTRSAIQVNIKDHTHGPNEKHGR